MASKVIEFKEKFVEKDVEVKGGGVFTKTAPTEPEKTYAPIKTDPAPVVPVPPLGSPAETITVDYSIYARHTLTGENPVGVDFINLKAGAWPDVLDEEDNALMPDNTTYTVTLRTPAIADVFLSVPVEFPPIDIRLVPISIPLTYGTPRNLQHKTRTLVVSGSHTVTRGESGAMDTVLDAINVEGIPIEVAVVSAGSVYLPLADKGSFSQNIEITADFTFTLAEA